MTTLMRRFNDEGLEPFDILFKNLFDTNTFFSPLVDSKPKYPITYSNNNPYSYKYGNFLNNPFKKFKLFHT